MLRRREPGYKVRDEMLMKLYYLYEKSAKRLRELDQLDEAMEKSAIKPTKARGGYRTNKIL